MAEVFGPNDHVTALSIDPQRGKLYAVTTNYADQTPPRIARIDAATMTVERVRPLPPELGRVYAMDIDPGRGYLYALVATSLNNDARTGFVRIALDSLAPEQPYVSMDLSGGFDGGVAVDRQGGHAYVGIFGHLMKVRLSDMARVGYIALPQDQHYQVTSVFVDPETDMAYFTSFFDHDSLLAVRRSDFTIAHERSMRYYRTGIPMYKGAMAPSRHAAYVAAGDYYDPDATVYKISVGDVHATPRELTIDIGAALPGVQGHMATRTFLVDDAGGFLYIGTTRTHNNSGKPYLLKVPLDWQC
jgi:hypothetical protein